MGARTCNNCFSCSLVTLNVLFSVASGCLLVIGVLLLVNQTLMTTENVPDPKSTFIPYGTHLAAYIAISAGSLICCVSMLGAFAGCLNRAGVYAGYIICLVLLILMEIALGAVAVMQWGELQYNFGTKGYCYLRNSPTAKCKNVEMIPGERRTFIEDLHRFQVELKCCGVQSEEDYWQDNVITNKTGIVAWTCCRRKPDYEAKNYDGVNDARKKLGAKWQSRVMADMTMCQRQGHNSTNAVYSSRGCKEALLDWLGLYFLLVIGCAFGLAVFQLLLITLASYLCRETSYD